MDRAKCQREETAVNWMDWIALSSSVFKVHLEVILHFSAPDELYALIMLM